MFHRKSFSARSFKAVSWRFPGEMPWDEPEIQPGAFAALSRPSAPLAKPLKRRARRRREQELLIL